MITESAAILLVVAMLVVILVRSKHYGYALGTAPLLLLPAAHLLIKGVLFVSKNRFFGFRPAIVTAFVDMLAVALTCVFVVMVGQKIESKRSKTLYLTVVLVYSVLLGWAYIFNSLHVLLG